MSSLAAPCRGSPASAMYSASKAFLITLAQALWAENRGAGIDVLARCAERGHDPLATGEAARHAPPPGPPPPSTSRRRRAGRARARLPRGPRPAQPGQHGRPGALGAQTGRHRGVRAGVGRGPARPGRMTPVSRGRAGPTGCRLRCRGTPRCGVPARRARERGGVSNSTPAAVILACAAPKSSTWRKNPTRPAAWLPTTAAWSGPSARASSSPVDAPGGRTTTQRLGRPSFVVRAGESSTRSKPSTRTKKSIAGSYSSTTTAMRLRCTAQA